MPSTRRMKRRIDTSDEEENGTFVNNSDYEAQSQVSSEDNDSSNSSGNGNGNNGNSNNKKSHSQSQSDDSDKDQTPDFKANEILNTTDDITRDEIASLGPGDTIDLNGTSKSSQSILPNEEVKQNIDQNIPNDNSPKSQIPQPLSQNAINSPRKSEVTTTKRNEPRLVIDRLVLTNFKSYAGSQVIGPFNASFSAVVGPNGSGKSNVIDAMLFVFGFRALKMRQGKLSELIHNSAGGEKLDFCQVDIHFQHVIDNDGDIGDYDVMPQSELVVSRRATKGNASQYYINNKSSNYTDVTGLLREKGIDLDHKRFLILQGEVESIAQMRAKAEREGDDGLLEYLEDIIGTAHYKQMIEDNLTKFDGLNDICIEKSNRFDLVSKDKEQLEDRKNEALTFLEMEKKLMNVRSIQFQVSISENTKLLNEKQLKQTDLNNHLDEERQKNEHLNGLIKESVKKQKLVKNEINDINLEIKRRNERLKSINRSIVSVDEKIKNLNNKLKKAIKSKELLEQSCLMATLRLESQNQTSAQYKQELGELSKQLQTEKDALDEIRRKMTNKTSEFTKEIESLQTKLEPWNDKLKEKEGNIKLIESSIEMLYNERKMSENKLESARERLVNIKSEGKQKELQYQENEAKLSHINEQITFGEDQCNEERKNVHSQKTELINLRQKTQDAVNLQSHHQNKNRVLNGLSRLAKSGRITGFHGRLGDLGVIDDKYDIAISTACPALDSMVVDTVETAQTCIQYLRKNHLGYANFICLDKLRKFDMSPIKTPGNPATVKRLFDLITPKHDRFLPAFYSKVFNTLVAANLQEARQVAYGPKRFRVVTLDGKLVDTSGTMSGGGNNFAKGAMILASSKMSDKMDVSEEDVDQLQNDLNKLESEFEKRSTGLQEKETQLRSLKDMKPEIEFNISRIKLEIESLTNEKKEVLALCKRLIAESETDESSKKIDEQISTKELEKSVIVEEINGFKEQMGDLESRIKALEEKIMEAGGVELRVQSSKVDSIKQKIEIINDKTSNEKMAVRKLENEIKRHNKVIHECTEEITKTEQELETVKSQDTNNQGELDELNKEINELEGRKDQNEQELESLSNELDEKNEEINNFKSFEIELKNKLENLNGIIKKCKHEIDQDEESLNALLVRDTTEYISWLDEEQQSKYNGNEIEKLDEESMKDVDHDNVEKEIIELEKYMNNVKVDIEVLKEYGLKITEFSSRQQELKESVEQRDEIKNYCEELKKKRLEEFMEGFNTISLSLKEMYQMITMGGNAELELVDSLDPFSEGILFSVMPPKKSWKNISNLSGGEKTLSSLALVFALHKYKPTPLYVMDEIDAALDFRNVSIVANYIKERTKNGQFIVISLRNNMFELSKQLVGIYKVNHMTKSISLQNKDFFN